MSSDHVDIYSMEDDVENKWKNRKILQKNKRL